MHITLKFNLTENLRLRNHYTVHFALLIDCILFYVAFENSALLHIRH